VGAFAGAGVGWSIASKALRRSKARNGQRASNVVEVNHDESEIELTFQKWFRSEGR
jgi:hypothetical protein